MVADITVCIGTYGDESYWLPLADVAKQSAHDQSLPPREVVTCHGPTLAIARNACAEAARSAWLLFLDADDTLDYRYVESMSRAIFGKSRLALCQPATLGVYPDGSEDDEPVMIKPAANLLERNHMVIGTLISKDVFDQVEGFRELEMYEDWDLWLRAWIYGGIEQIQVPDAIYRVGVNDGSRNKADLGGTYTQIRSRYESDAIARFLK